MGCPCRILGLLFNRLDLGNLGVGPTDTPTFHIVAPFMLHPKCRSYWKQVTSQEYGNEAFARWATSKTCILLKGVTHGVIVKLPGPVTTPFSIGCAKSTPRKRLVRW